MKIEPRMDLTELAQHMGRATPAEARRMRELLLESPRGRTEDFTGAEWAALVLRAAAGGGEGAQPGAPEPDP